MTVYKGNKNTIKWAAITLLTFIGMILMIYFFTGRGFFPWFLIASLLLMCIPTYQGMIISISIDENKLVIRRPISWQTLKLSNVAFTAVHEIGEDKSVLFVFTKQKWGSSYRIKGIRSKMSYEESMEALAKGGRIQDFKVNFNLATKVPVSMVENGEELKERILDSVDAHHCKAVYN
ncbi:MAG: hypothetical protein WCY24_08390 [Lutispora sp.]|nr:hypothetical protein [Lutispora sp.]MDD4834404.1 hypothetical protein [Lutispora sp.]